jgi:hypothetical protein
MSSMEHGQSAQLKPGNLTGPSRGLVCKKDSCARISMMARSDSSIPRPDRFMRTAFPFEHSDLRCAADP